MLDSRVYLKLLCVASSPDKHMMPPRVLVPFADASSGMLKAEWMPWGHLALYVVFGCDLCPRSDGRKSLGRLVTHHLICRSAHGIVLKCSMLRMSLCLC